MPSRVLGPGLAIFFKRPLKHWSLLAAITHRRIAFVPEGSFLDRSVTLNCRIRVYMCFFSRGKDNDFRRKDPGLVEKTATKFGPWFVVFRQEMDLVGM
jgi:hypothetical protein